MEDFTDGKVQEVSGEIGGVDSGGDFLSNSHCFQLLV